MDKGVEQINYRKIYRDYHGTIPKDETGRSYEIHHVDGDKSNNDIDNLKALSLEEHYNVHLKQGDWGACYMIAKKMKLAPSIISELALKTNQSRVDAGTHNFLGGEIQRTTQRRLAQEGNHMSQITSKNGTHKWNGDGNPTHSMLKNNSHPFQNSEIQRKNVRALNSKMLTNGTHPFLCKTTCTNTWCGRDIQIANFKSHKKACDKKGSSVDRNKQRNGGKYPWIS